jgi:SAM-dependent methyltransferase
VRLFLTDVTLQGDAAVACDGSCLPFHDEFFDCIIVDQVLEHAAHPTRIVDEVSRCLKPDGIVYSGVPFLMPVHGYPYDFQRFTPLGHRLLYSRFEELDFRITQGPFSAASLNLAGVCASLWDNVWWNRITSLMTRVVIGPFLRLDRRFTGGRTLNVPAASLFIGRKLPVELSASEVMREWIKTAEREKAAAVS